MTGGCLSINLLAGHIHVVSIDFHFFVLLFLYRLSLCTCRLPFSACLGTFCLNDRFLNWSETPSKPLSSSPNRCAARQDCRPKKSKQTTLFVSILFPNSTISRCHWLYLFFDRNSPVHQLLYANFHHKRDANFRSFRTGLLSTTSPSSAHPNALHVPP